MSSHGEQILQYIYTMYKHPPEEWCINAICNIASRIVALGRILEGIHSVDRKIYFRHREVPIH